MVVVTYGPPSTTRLPSAFALRTTSRRDSFCTSMAVANTMSAHSMSEDFNACTFKSISFRSHDSGSSADTVNSPNGGNAQRFPSKGNACRKLQYVSGNSGLTNKTFIFLRLSSFSKPCLKNQSRRSGAGDTIERELIAPQGRDGLTARFTVLIATHRQYIAGLTL